ncbi:MAG TPA: T9SS type A sorting domain-containing protein, partial [Prolixibacteraceae bacterium]|nr:T9SS type A sorting domain-containing protein [Prolixibacteraceae bacterium]
VNNNIPTANIDTITNLDVSEKNISDLTGIKDFVALTRLKLTNNQLTNLDISKNTAIQILYCNFNQFSSLNLSANTALKTLYCNNNQLSSLDVSKNLALKTLNYSDNQLPNLDLSVNKALTSLFCSKNQLSSLNLSANTALTQLNCDNNQLQSIDVSKNTALGTFNCKNNQLQILDLSKNIALLYLYCDNNQITSLNVSKNTALTYLICANNQLVNLDLRNGNNANIKQFNATVNPNLTCIYVDDKTASYLSEWEKDETAKWANNEADCGTLVNEINEQTISIYPNPTTGILNIDFSGEQVQRLTISDVVGKKVFEKNKVNKTEAIDLSGFKNGIYMLIVQTEDENRSFKIIKE